MQGASSSRRAQEGINYPFRPPDCPKSTPLSVVCWSFSPFALLVGLLGLGLGLGYQDRVGLEERLEERGRWLATELHGELHGFLSSSFPRAGWWREQNQGFPGEPADTTDRYIQRDGLVDCLMKIVR